MDANYKLLHDQVVWAITHYGLVPTEGIIDHLRATLHRIDTGLESIKQTATKQRTPCFFCGLVGKHHKSSCHIVKVAQNRDAW